MRNIEYNLEIGYAGCNSEGEMPVEDGMTNAQIDEMVHEMAMEWAQSWEGDQRLGWDPEQTDEEREEETTWFYENVYGCWKFIDNEA